MRTRVRAGVIVSGLSGWIFYAAPAPTVTRLLAT
jgi:hypothetical protein